MFKHGLKSAAIKHAFTSTSLHLDNRIPLGDIGSLLKIFRAERGQYYSNGLITKVQRRYLSDRPQSNNQIGSALDKEYEDISDEHFEPTTGDSATDSWDEPETGPDNASDTLFQLYTESLNNDTHVEGEQIANQNVPDPLEMWRTERDHHGENQWSAIQQARASSQKQVHPRILKYSWRRYGPRPREMCGPDVPESEQSSTVPQRSDESPNTEWDSRLKKAKQKALFEPLFQSFRNLIMANAGPGPPSRSDPSLARLAQIRAEAMMNWVDNGHSVMWPAFLEANRLFLWYFVANFETGTTRYLPGAIDLVVENYKLVLISLENYHPVSYRTALKIITRSCNMILVIIFFAVQGRRFESLEAAYQCQSKMVDAMANMTPQIPLLRRGYRALIALQLVYPPNAHEWNWRSRQAKSWPPWRMEQSGVDQNIEENIVRSRAQKLLRQMQQDGYSWKTWEKRASILSGWDLDDSPTIATAIFMGTVVHGEPEVDELEDSQNPMIWGAKIRATRTMIEAWSMYLSAEDHGVQGGQLASAIIERLVAEDRRKLRSNNALDAAESEEFDRLSMRIWAGSVNSDIEPPSTDPRYHPRVRRNVPELSDFLDEIRPQEYKLSVPVTNLLLLHSRDWIEFGGYLRDFVKPNMIAFNLLANPLAMTMDDLSSLNSDLLLIFHRRLIDRGPPTADDCQALGISNKAWTQSDSCAIRVMCHIANTGIDDDSFVTAAIVKHLTTSPLPLMRMMLQEKEFFEEFLQTRSLFLSSRDQFYHLIETASNMLEQPSFHFLEVITQVFHQTRLIVDAIIQKQSEYNDPDCKISLSLLRQKDEFILREIDKVFTKITGTSLNTVDKPETFKALPVEHFWHAYIELLRVIDDSKISDLKIWLDVHKRNWLSNPRFRDLYFELLESVSGTRNETEAKPEADREDHEGNEQGEEERGFW